MGLQILHLINEGTYTCSDLSNRTCVMWTILHHLPSQLKNTANVTTTWIDNKYYCSFLHSTPCWTASTHCKVRWISSTPMANSTPSIASGTFPSRRPFGRGWSQWPSFISRCTALISTLCNGRWRPRALAMPRSRIWPWALWRLSCTLSSFLLPQMCPSAWIESQNSGLAFQRPLQCLSWHQWQRPLCYTNDLWYFDQIM